MFGVVIEKLEAGGMAEVFVCRLTGIGGFDKTVVVKRILPHLLQEKKVLDMFLDEARLAASLHHVNIAETYENELTIQLRVLTNLIEPAMIIVMAVMVGGLLLFVLLKLRAGV